jgi:negative regulator of flagellin synthesis FlgM
MKIQGNQRMNGINPYQKLNPPIQDKTKGTPSLGKDEVQISTEAKELLQFSKSDGASREARVQDIKTQVQAGTYRVDSDKIAEKMYGQIKKG